MAKYFVKDENGNLYTDQTTKKPLAVDVADESETIVNFLASTYSRKVVDTEGALDALYGIDFMEKGITEAVFPNVSVIGKTRGFVYDTNNMRSVSGATFMSCSQLSRISFPNCQSFVFVRNFCDCYELESAVFPNFASNTIQSSTFLNCSKLSMVDFPTVDDVGASAFANCGNLQTFNTQVGLSDINRAAFYNCSRLENIKFTSNASNNFRVGVSAFYNCGFKSIKINCNSAVLELSAFANCRLLEDFTINATTLSFSGAGTFNSCSSLKEVTISVESGQITFDRGREFTGCISLENVSLSAPDGVKFLSSYLFSNCFALKWGDLSNANIVELAAYSCFTNCSNLDYAYFPEASRITGGYAFDECEKLSYVYAPKVLSFGGNGMFMSCTNLSYIYAPVVSSFYGNNYIFSRCVNLASIYIMQESGLTENNIPVIPFSNFLNYSGSAETGLNTPDGHTWIYVGYEEYVPWLQSATNWATYSSWIKASQFVTPTE